MRLLRMQCNLRGLSLNQMTTHLHANRSAPSNAPYFPFLQRTISQASGPGTPCSILFKYTPPTSPSIMFTAFCRALSHMHASGNNISLSLQQQPTQADPTPLPIEFSGTFVLREASGSSNRSQPSSPHAPRTPRRPCALPPCSNARAGCAHIDASFEFLGLSLGIITVSPGLAELQCDLAPLHPSTSQLTSENCPRASVCHVSPIRMILALRYAAAAPDAPRPSSFSSDGKVQHTFPVLSEHSLRDATVRRFSHDCF
jgi:hypothetical protein